ncbi:MAG: carbohydrate binding family 9 domain-containing protein, partial [Acidobacteria bacterium]|nr:carbohydrate binding family 9 domain-containing protein [Acidobacteriota bacterium]
MSPIAAGVQLDYQNIRLERKIVAVRVDQKVVIDGELNEPVWNLPAQAGNFIQNEPRAGEPATEKTEVRVLYDPDYLYIGVYCFDSQGRKGITVNDLNKDFVLTEGDSFIIMLDTFGDRRNGIMLATNPLGARYDQQVTANGNNLNPDWDAIWFVKSKITDQGWQAEIAIPFKSLRFRNSDQQRWGINFQRRVRRKNETAAWSPIPRQFRFSRVSLAGSLLGISGIEQGRNLYLKPYLLAPFLRREKDDWDFTPDAGLDVKLGLSSQLTLDLTVNTDFSKVEADLQQINLTRFSLFFPEKRDFF